MLMCMYFCLKKTSFNKSIFLLCFPYVCFLNSIYFLCVCECGHIRAMECIYRSEDNFRELAFTFHLVEAKSLLLIVTVSLLQAIWPTSFLLACLSQPPLWPSSAGITDVHLAFSWVPGIELGS